MMNKMLLIACFYLAAFMSGTASGQVKIGLGAPITGPNAAIGMQFRQGVEQAVEDINTSGGINGQKLQLIVGNDRSDPTEGVSVARKLVAEGAQWIIGHYNSGVSIPASEIYAEAGAIQITPASTSLRFTERAIWNTFRICGSDDQQGTTAGTYLAEKFRGKKVAIVHDKTPYGKGFADQTRKKDE